MLRIKILFLVLFGIAFRSNCQESKSSNAPKLVVGIVVDQLRFEHLYKYEKMYSEDGFKRLLRNGFNYKNTHFNYIPTETAPGHASIYTGTTPKTHGIIGNSWYDRYSKSSIGNVIDTSTVLIGLSEKTIPGRSPRNLLSTTISDQLRLFSNFRSKIISISLKDRGAILPGGFTANACYWHDWQNSKGSFVTSSYYMDEIPAWTAEFNSRQRSDHYLDTIWQTLFPIEQYVESAPDNNPFERTLRGKKAPVFPYDFKSLRNTYRDLGAEYQILWLSPFGNTLLTEFAIEAIENEDLGKDDIPDLLNISYSVLDVIGHAMGPQSIEFQDAYVRLDRDIANLLKYLDHNVGKENYSLFLTSDHGSSPVPSFLKAQKIKTGIANLQEYETSLGELLADRYGKGEWIEEFNYENIYLNRDLIKSAGIDLSEIQTLAASFLNAQNGIAAVLTSEELRSNDYTSNLRSKLQNGHYKERSGDIIMTFDAGFKATTDSELKTEDVKGASHGSAYTYDTHVPLIWYGKGINQGESNRKIDVIDIAPTISMLLNIGLPSGAEGNPLNEVLEG